VYKFSFEKDKLLFLLILADATFLLLHILYVYTTWLPTSYFSLSRDRGYAEFFQYTKELWIAALFLLLGVRQRKALYLVFSVIFFYLMLDDSLALHENLGAHLAERLLFQPAYGLRAVDYGELLVYALFGGAFFFTILITFALSDPTARMVGRTVLFLLVLFSGFSVVLDMLEIMTKIPWVSEIFKILEESGEMVVMSLITWYVFRLDLEAPHVSPA
jgi:hypothetical protein